MLASQVNTCIYLEDTKYGDPWKVVVPIELRGTFNVLEKDDGEDEPNKVAYQESTNSLEHRFAADVEEGKEVQDGSVNADEEMENVDVDKEENADRDDKEA